MKRSRTSALLLAAGACGCIYAAAHPAFGQDAPESLLPPGFEDPVPPPPPPPPGPAPAAPAPTPSVQLPDEPPLAGDEREEDERSAAADDEVDEDLGLLGSALDEVPPEYELPPGARRSLARVGPLTPDNGGYREDAFAGIDGRYLTVLMRNLSVPGPSRWLHIALRRAMLSRVPTPEGLNAADWIAERAWLLLRMGEVDGARLLVQRVDGDRYTPKLYAVAMQTGLASADIAAFCPLVIGARRVAETPAWTMADAICAGLAGESVRATTLMAQARRQGITNRLDLLLGERAANAGASASAVDVSWDGVERINAWRFGIANATGLEIPDEIYASGGRQVAAWRARSPTIPLADRIAPARVAAALGVFSNRTLVTLYSALLPEIDPDELSVSPTGYLRDAYVRDGAAERVQAMRALWDQTEGPADRYAGLILTARAAARIPPSADLAEDAGNLIAAMMTAGLDIQAATWAETIEDADAATVDQAWALLAVGAPEPVVDVSFERVQDYASRAGSAGRHRARLLAAALAGLGRLDDGAIAEANSELGLGLDRETVWTRHLDRAVRLRRSGAVALLAAVGMQTSDWSGVPASHLFRAIRALRLVGREAEARMIAAEAVTRA